MKMPADSRKGNSGHRRRRRSGRGLGYRRGENETPLPTVDFFSVLFVHCSPSVGGTTRSDRVRLESWENLIQIPQLQRPCHAATNGVAIQNCELWAK